MVVKMKNYILDTNVLLYDPNAIHRFKKNLIIIPVEIVDILDRFKRNITELGQNSRTVSNYLEQLSGKGDLGKGVSLENGDKIRLFAEEYEDCLSARGLESKKKVDNRLLNLAISLTKKDPKTPTIIISKNINLRLKADALGIKTADYEDKQTPLSGIYTGFVELSVSRDVICKLQEEGRYCFTDRKFSPNDYILLKDEQDSKSKILGRISGNDGVALTPLPQLHDDVLGIRPMNLGQTFAFNALLDDNIKLVSLLGKAGTGKTLIAVAAGLYKVLREGEYTKLLISRPTMPMGRDIGFILGDIDEKMRPWMQPIYDAVEMIREQDRRSRKRSLPKDILESDDLVSYQ